MKLVVDFMTPNRANKFARLLRREGIPSFVGISRVGHHPNRFIWGQRTYGVWVLVESQHREALSLAEGNEVKVSNPLSEEEMILVEKQAIRKDRITIIRDISVFFVAVMAFVIFVVVASK
ncbi:hypothetical protein [Agaribacterium sp. ZY112]|uniref:hypothetical protein n=1 Tax=Agaribacterium sp. ZY112 TaxID=3233574 RepID=UPI0035268F15